MCHINLRFCSERHRAPSHVAEMEAYVFNHAAQSNAVHGRVGRLMFVMSHFDSTVDGLLNLIAALQETGGNLETGISRGLTSQQIDALPLVKVTRAQHQLTLNCAVCLEDYHLDEAVKELPCKVINRIHLCVCVCMCAPFSSGIALVVVIGRSSSMLMCRSIFPARFPSQLHC